MVLGLLSGKKTNGDKGRAKHQTHQHHCGVCACWRYEMKRTSIIHTTTKLERNVSRGLTKLMKDWEARQIEAGGQSISPASTGTSGMKTG